MTQYSRPGSLIAGWWNVTLCGGLVVFGVVSALLLPNPLFMLLAIVAAAMEFVFVRKLLEIVRDRRALRAPLLRVAEDAEQHEQRTDPDGEDARDEDALR